ncbi:hypothetical protein POM88_026324 [Heracleum sosnowskyi]|uniref:Thiolase N-terminal domain-containing protein n=1 Tax=Heracleum sosnowskyi TaxID=360622 RepID=A0AAD8I6M4_9APIA|nr:hypothetical protein POM88_026324 [Heracleum sosnowskyi]
MPFSYFFGASHLYMVIVAAKRTAICKAKMGEFKDTYADDFLAPALKAVIDKKGVNPSEIADIVVGTVLVPGSQRAAECKMAAFYAGFPETVPVRTMNRQCSSGLQAVAHVAAAIKAGFYDIGIGAELESMIANSMGWDGTVNPRVKSMEHAQNCLLPMGSGKFKDEIVLIHTKIVDAKTGDETPVTISTDDGIRANTNVADLGKLRPSFKKDGTTTTGNSSQVSDAATSVLLMKRNVM